MNDKYEQLGKLIDDIESLTCGLELPMPASFHVEQLKNILPEKIKSLKEAYVSITGENPWE